VSHRLLEAVFQAGPQGQHEQPGLGNNVLQAKGW